jgi:archaemetzincin
MNLQKNIVLITKIGEVVPEILFFLTKDLVKHLKVFNLLVEINPEGLELDSSELDLKRKQYKGSQILSRINELTRNMDVFRNLGIIDEDIFANNLNFIFGLAMKPQRMLIKFPTVALISIVRLREFYGKPSNNDLFRERILKEALHELGHTFGLDHCQNYCVMRFSNTLGETDQKPQNYCTSCNKQIFEALSN